MKRLRAAKALVMVVVLAAMLCASQPLAPWTAQASGSPSSANHRYIIFLPGVCPDKSSTKALANIPAFHAWIQTNLLCGPLKNDGRVDAAKRAASAFGALITQLKQVPGFTLPNLVYFSYGHDPNAYTPSDSQQPLALSVKSLNTLIDQKLCADPQASIDLVGHSLGDPVAADWVVTDAIHPLPCGKTQINVLDHIHSLVTFDSPLQGVKGSAYPLDHAETWVTQVFGTALIAAGTPVSVVAGALVDYYAGALVSPVDADITAAAPLINGTSKIKNPPLPLLKLLPNRVVSIGNLGDKFINQDASWVGKGSVEKGSNNNPVVNDCKSGPSDFVCHVNVLFDPIALQWTVNMIVRQQVPTDQAGGWWSGSSGGVSVLLEPNNSATLTFSAHAYTMHRLQTIDQVKFTGQWQEGSNRSWETVCPSVHQTADGDFGCSGLVRLPVGFTGPTAHLKVGFDVYLNNQPPRQSPNGNKTVLFSTQSPAPAPAPIPPTAIPVPPTAIPIPPTNTPAPLAMTISVTPTTVMVGQANQLCITASEAASVVLTYTYNGGPSNSIPLQTPNFNAGATCFPSNPLTVPGTVVITAVGTPTGGGASVSSQATITVVSPALIVPGGVWVAPANGSTTSGTVEFEAEAYPTNPGDPPIDHVNFTVGWAGLTTPSWPIACTETAPIASALDGHVIYGCTVDLSSLSPQPPPGTLEISFDVYDSQYVQGQPGHYNLAPNGVHTIVYQPVRPPAAPANVQATAMDPTDAGITWTDPTGDAQGFRIYDGSTLLDTVGAGAGADTVGNLTPGTYNCFKVEAFNSAGTNDSAWRCLTLPLTGPTEQLTVNPISGAAGSTVCLTWIDDNDSPGGSGTISFDGQQIGSYQAGSTTENWSGCLAIPAGAQPGPHTISLAEASDNSGGSTTFTVNGGSSGALLGPVDLNAYCQFLGDSGVILNGTTAYNWYCVTGNGSQVGINMNGACVWQYSRTDAIARAGAVSDPNSWRCYTP